MRLEAKRLEVKQLPSRGIFIGIDTGTSARSNPGWGVVNIQQEIVAHGHWDLSAKHLGVRPAGPYHDKSLEFRMFTLRHLIANWCYIQPGKVLAIGIENPWIGPNHQTGLTLAKVYGVCFCKLSAVFNVVPYTVAPVTAKRALTGRAKASKAEMVRVAQAMGMLGNNSDEADAIGIALAALGYWKRDYLGMD